MKKIFGGYALLLTAAFSILILGAVSTVSGAPAAVPSFVIDSLDAPVGFAGKPFILLRNGDDPSWAGTAFDDADWTRTSLPSNWNDQYPGYTGICWYRIHFRFPEQHPDRAIGVHLGLIIDADEVYFNGTRIGASGAFPPDRKSAYDKERVYQIPSLAIIPGGDNVLAIRVIGLFDYVNGLYTGKFIIGDYDRMQQDLFYRTIFDICLIVVNIVVGIYFLLFFIKLPESRENLIFSLFNLSLAFYFFARTPVKYWLGLDFHVFKKIEYLVLSLLFALFVEFCYTYFKRKRSILYYIFIATQLAAFALVLFTGSPALWDAVIQKFAEPPWLIGVGLALYILITECRRNADARLMLVTLLIFFMTVVHDICAQRLWINSSLFIFNFGFLIFTGSIAIILANRFVRLHHEVRELNQGLENKVRERTEELQAANEEMAAINEDLIQTRDQLWGEMQVAKKIQTVLLPRDPKVLNYEIGAFMAPASDVGGDYYDVISCGGKSWLVIGDVSGHGVPAGLIMMMAQTSIRTVLELHPDYPPRRLLTAINRVLSRSVKQMLEYNYITITVLACLDGGKFYYSGLHQDILVYRCATATVDAVETSGVWVGLIDDIEGMVQDSELNLEIGDVMLLFTDGVTEAWIKGSVKDHRPETDMFGETQLIDMLRQAGTGTPDEIIRTIYASLGDYDMRDDVTMVAVKRTG